MMNKPTPLAHDIQFEYIRRPEKLRRLDDFQTLFFSGKILELVLISTTLYISVWVFEVNKYGHLKIQQDFYVWLKNSNYIAYAILISWQYQNSNIV